MAKELWEDGSLRILQDGNDVGVLNVKDFSFDAQITTHEDKYMGEKTPRLDATYNGENFSFTFQNEENSTDFDAVMDRHERGFRERDGTGLISLVVTRTATGLTEKAYRFSNCILTRSTRGAENTPWQTSISGRAELKERL